MTIEELYIKYHLELVKWCQSMSENPQTAEEIVQEAFLRAMFNEELLLQLKERQARAWLYRTAKNIFVDQIRRKNKETIVDEIPERIKESEKLTELEWDELLERLPDGEGVIFAMRYLQGYNSRQIGEILSMPAGTVRCKLHSARKHLREEIGGI